MAKWRNKIEIKKYFSNDESNEMVLNVLNLLIPQLKAILKKEQQRKHNKLDDYDLQEFENLIEDFEWVKDMIEKGVDSSEYEYINWCEAFNGYLEQLYDMGDMVTGNHNDFWDREKFLWVG
jgi:hypothetical protein